MSSLPAVVSSRLPMLLAGVGSKAWRTVVAGVVLLVALAVAATLMMGRQPDRRATVVTQNPELAEARARALARAKEQAAGRAMAEARPASAPLSSRVADASLAADLFGKHSWYVPPPPPPAVAPPPPAPPSAPPFPYSAMGSFAPQGTVPVYFLARGDRVVDVHVGDRVDGVYEFESADNGQLVFNYLPLNIRQSVPLGVAP